MIRHFWTYDRGNFPCANSFVKVPVNINILSILSLVSLFILSHNSNNTEKIKTLLFKFDNFRRGHLNLNEVCSFAFIVIKEKGALAGPN